MTTRPAQSMAMLTRMMKKFGQRKMEKIDRARQVCCLNFKSPTLSHKFVIFRSWRWRVDDSSVRNRSKSHLAIDARLEHSPASCHHIVSAQLQEGRAEAATEGQGRIHVHYRICLTFIITLRVFWETFYVVLESLCCPEHINFPPLKIFHLEKSHNMF